MGRYFSFGIDESNNGDYPEFFCLVGSNFKSDVKRSKKTLEKKRGFDPKRPKRMRKRKISFTYFLNPHEKIMGCPGLFQEINQGYLPQVIFSLLLPFREYLEPYERISFFIDGLISPPLHDFLIERISDFLLLPPENISVLSGSHFDEKYPLVNLADELANYFKRLYYSETLANFKKITARYFTPLLNRKGLEGLLSL